MPVWCVYRRKWKVFTNSHRYLFPGRMTGDTGKINGRENRTSHAELCEQFLECKFKMASRMCTINWMGEGERFLHEKSINTGTNPANATPIIGMLSCSAFTYVNKHGNNSVLQIDVFREIYPCYLSMERHIEVTIIIIITGKGPCQWRNGKRM